MIYTFHSLKMAKGYGPVRRIYGGSRTRTRNPYRPNGSGPKRPFGGAFGPRKKPRTDADFPFPFSFTMTDTEDKKKKRRLAKARPYRSAGFIKRGKRKYAKKNYAQQKWGISLNKEAGKLYTATECMFVGHSTCPVQTIRECMWRALVKRLYIGAGGYDFSVFGAVQCPVGTMVDVFFKNDGPTSPQIIQTFTFVLGDTLETLAQWLGNQGRPFNDGQYANTRVFTFLRMIQPIPPGGLAYPTDHLQESRILLANATVTMEISSSLKIQNRSINKTVYEGGVDADNVDRVPLYGKSYEGNGSGTYTKSSQQNPAGSNFNSDMIYGIIEQGALSNELKEPPYASDFIGVKRSGKVKIEPGTIKTSVLTYKKTMKFSDLQRELGTSQDVAYLGNIPDADRKVVRFGKYRFFGLEKIIDATSGIPITLGLEHNIRVNMWTKLKDQFYNVQITEKDYLPGGTFV